MTFREVTAWISLSLIAVVLFIIFVGVFLCSCFRAVQKKPLPASDMLAPDPASKYGAGVESLSRRAYGAADDAQQQQYDAEEDLDDEMQA